MGLILNKWLNCAAALLMVLVVFSTLPPTTGSDSKPASEYSEYNRLLEVKTNKMYYKPGEEIAITIHNRADMDIGFETNPKFVIKDADGNVVYPTSPLRRPQQQENYGLNAEMSQGSWNLATGAKEMYSWDQATITLPELEGGLYTIETVSYLSPEQEGISMIFIRDKGYVLLVAGNNNDDMQNRVDEACNQIYDDLRSIGYGHSDIWYLNGWDNYRVDDLASSDTVEDGIKIWAAGRVTTTDPLFIVLFDHGGNNHFCVDNTVVGNDNVWASELNNWIGDLQEDTDTEVFLWYMGCHSGSVIDEISGDKRIIITSSSAGENSGTAPAPYNEKLSSRYWPAIRDGDSLGEAFNTGSHYVAETLGSYHPLLDDDSDGVGHGWDTPDPSGYLPHDGDGYYANNVYMGGPVLAMPFFRDLVAAQAFRWPMPPLTIPLEVDLARDAIPVKVTASMIPSFSAAAYDGIFLEDIPYVDFALEDPDGDGTWTVDIPVETIMEYYKRPGLVQFIINAEDDEGQNAMPVIASVEFTQDGTPSADTTPPNLRLITPKPQGIIDGLYTLSAVASDNSCVDYAEIYVNDILVDTVELPSSSNYYFEYERDTSELPDGEYTITVTVYDCSGNSFSKSVSVTVLNEPTMQSCKLTKLNVIGQLEEVRTGDKKLDGLLEAAILNIKESLDEELWNGDYQLNPKFGHKVPVREKSAVMNLWQLYRNKAADDGVKQACYNAVVALLACDHQLARTVYNEAKKYAGDAKVDRELCSAESAFDAAIEVLTDEDQKPEIKAFKAIDLYKRAMEHSETAIVFGIK